MEPMVSRWILFISLLWACSLSVLPKALAASPPKSGITSKSSKTAKLSFQNQVQPLLNRYCYPCHGEKKKGDLDLRIYTDETIASRDRHIFEKVLKNLQAHEMPPESKPQPTPAERDLITRWVSEFFFPCDCNHPDPGRVTIRRLNRAEYNNTIRDLAGVDFQPAADFPADDSGYGFDNIGDVLSLSPVLLEKYLAAAEKILVAADVRRLQSIGQKSEIKGQKSEPANERLDSAREIIATFARRAFRRPVSDSEVGRYLKLFKSATAEGESFETSLKLALEAILVSPHFLFRGELQPDPNDPGRIHPVDEYALASRLSYFLWSSMPDEELFALAERGTLRRNLEKQVKRMLKDPKSTAFVQNFTGQWLQLRNLKLISLDPKQFPEFNDAMRVAMQRETELFFEAILREDRSVLEFLDANYTFLNERLAPLYGIRGIEGEQFRRVSLDALNPLDADPTMERQRGGLLTQASILTLTSNPTRTSPVKRGKWVLENILGAPPPPPPPDVPKLEEGKAALTGTLRQRMEQHRANPGCASCHTRMDPIGFGFENFDAIGRWRDHEEEVGIDASGELVSGETFNGPAQLKTILLNQKRDDFVRCLTEKVLTYALGRGMEYYDKCAVDQIARKLPKEHYRFSTLIVEVVKSTPFQMGRGEQAPAAVVARQDGASE
jgi:hypothetical protein